MLGFTINPKLTPLIERTGEQVAVSAERMGVLDADVIVVATEQPSDVAALKKVPTFDRIPRRRRAARRRSAWSIVRGGASRARTGDLVTASHALSQLSYSPGTGNGTAIPSIGSRRGELRGARR